MLLGHGGNINNLAASVGCSPDEIIDMSSNLNPLGPPDNTEKAILRNLDTIRTLPEPDAASMKKGFAEFHNINGDNVVAGSGTTWFIYNIPAAMGCKKVLISGPAYSDYRDACIMHKVKCRHCFARESNMFVPDINEIAEMAESADTIFICNPDNPTGALLSKEELEYLIKKHADKAFVIDESYLPFAENGDDISLVSDLQYKNLIVLSSMSKIFSIPGLRTGFLSSSREIVKKMMTYYQPWSVNSLAQAVIKDIFDNPEQVKPFYQKTRAFIKKEKKIFTGSLKNIKGLKSFTSSTYFILAKLPQRIRSAEFCREIGKHRVLIRDCSNFEGLSDQYVRFSLKKREDNLLLANLIREIL